MLLVNIFLTTSKVSLKKVLNVLFPAKLLQPAPINLKPSLRLHFDNIWAATYGTFCKVANKDEVYVFGLNNYNQLGKHFRKCKRYHYLFAYCRSEIIDAAVCTKIEQGIFEIQMDCH